MSTLKSVLSGKKPTGKPKPVQSSRSAEFIHSSDDSSNERPSFPVPRVTKSIKKKDAVQSRKDSPALPRRPKDVSAKPLISNGASTVPKERSSFQSEPTLPRYPKFDDPAKKGFRSTERLSNGKRALESQSEEESSGEDSGHSSTAASDSESEDDWDGRKLQESMSASRVEQRKSSGKRLKSISQPVEQSSSNPLKRKRPSPSPSASESASRSETEAENESSSDDSSSSAVRSNQPAPTSQTVPSSQRSQPGLATVSRYKPPPDFAAATVSDVSPQVSGQLSTASLEGKNVWQIAIPASIPLDTITTIPLNSIIDGTPILAHNGTHYSVSTQRDGVMEGEMLLLPDAESNQYRNAKGVKLSQSLRIQEIPNKEGMPPVRDDDVMAVDLPETPTEKRRQPQGIRMRWRPFGDYDGESVSGGEESMQDVQPSRAVFRKPKKPNGVSSDASPRKPVDESTKRKKKEGRQAVSRGEAVDSPKPQSDDRRRDTNISDHGPPPPQPPASSRKKHKNYERDVFEVASDHDSSAQQPSVTQPSTSSASPRKKHETAEEKARRREERKKRKALRARDE